MITFFNVVPEDPPQSFNSIPSKFSIICMFIWSSPLIPNGIIITYNLTVCNINTDVSTTYIINGSQHSFIARNFEPYQRYSASLSATTVTGYGPPAYISGRTESDSKGKK